MDKSRDIIETWLVEQLARHTGLDPRRIDVQQPLTAYGLDSIVAVELTADLEEWLGRPVPETLLWDVPTIRAIARVVAQGTDDEHADERPAPAPPGPGLPAPRPHATPGASGAHQQLQPEPAHASEPIAVVGLACRVPGAADAQAFWQLLLTGTDATGEPPGGRWQGELPADAAAAHVRGGFLEGIDLFDAHFFSISPREATHMDPQQRLLLEVAWQALEHAGLAPDELAGSQAGVFLGISTHDYDRVYAADHTLIDAYTNTGNAHSIAASRLAYILDLHGPSMAVDTACSSSLLAVHLACQSLRSGETSLALVGGVNILLSPAPTIGFARARMISARGSCRPFDAEADGLVRGEGCGVVVLKRAADASAHGDRILALIRGSAVNQDGHSQGLTAPNGQAQRRVIAQALRAAGVEPAALGYIVAQGTGTPLGDAVEFQALADVLGERPQDKDRCALASIKANIGHLEAASGVVSMIAAILALQHDTIPAQIHFQHPHPQIDLQHSPLTLPTAPLAWPRGERPRVAAVSAFSFSGTNVHLVLSEAPARPAPTGAAPLPLSLLPLSARSEPALRDLVDAYIEFLQQDCPADALADLCFTASVGRAHFDHRLAVMAQTPAQLCAALQEARAHLPRPAAADTAEAAQPGLAMLCSPQGAEYAHMGRQLYETQSVFRTALDRCDALLAEMHNRSLLQALYPAPDQQSLLREPAYRRLATFALDYALAQLWLAWGVLPAVVAGYGVGVYVAACLAGALSLEDALVLVSEQERLWQTSAAQEASDLLCPPAVSPSSLQAFERVAGLLPSHPLSLPLICTTTGQSFPAGACLDAAYWQRQLRGASTLEDGIAHVARRGYTTFVEVGPAVTLSQRGAALAGAEGRTWVPGLAKDLESDWHSLWHGVQTLYVDGHAIRWSALYEGMAAHIVSLPTYPFQREHYWIASAAAAPTAGQGAEAVPSHPLLGQRIPQHQLL